LKRRGETTPKSFRQPTPKEGFITVSFTFFLVGEIASLLGWSPSTTTVLPTPIDTYVSLLIIIFSLVGWYGLLFRNELGLYSAILVPFFEIVFGAFSLIGQGRSSLFRASAAVALGITAFTAVLTSVMGQKNINHHDRIDEGKGQYAVELVDLGKTYLQGPIRVDAIKDLTLRIRHGEFIAIMGPSGSGKSTLLNMIGALDRPTTGRILIDCAEINTLDEDGLAEIRNEKVGFVFQAYNLIARTKVLRNMELPLFVKGYSKRERSRRINELLEVVGLPEMASRKPNTLSGGEQQRIAIARALINNPTIILADEPSGNLDTKTRDQIIGYLRRINMEKGTTIVLVTHDVEAARIADRIIYLRDGSIVREEKRAV